MTVKDIADYWRDREFLPREDQKVVLKMGDTLLEVKGTMVPEKGPVSVELAPAPVKKLKKFMFSLKFEANPVIEAESLEKAEKIAYEMMQGAAVTKAFGSLVSVQDGYVAQEPRLLKTKEGEGRRGGQGMIRLSWNEIESLVDAVEKARAEIGRGFFWYYLHLDAVLVRDPGLTDVGYANLADRVRRHIDAKRWHVAPDGDNGLKIEAKED